MNMNNAWNSFGQLAAAFEKPVLKMGLPAWCTHKLSHAVLCEVNTAWWYVAPESCEEAYILKSKRRLHDTQRWHRTFEAQWVNMLLSTQASTMQHGVYDVFVHPLHCLAHCGEISVALCSYDISLYDCWMSVQICEPGKLMQKCRYFEEL